MRITKGHLTPDQVGLVLEEIAGYEVELEEDPTQPELGNKYLQRILSKCRKYLNRVQYYLEIIRVQERDLKLNVKESELDLDFKEKELLADDAEVRRMPSIKDRMSLVAIKLKDENEALNKKRIELLDIEETVKIIKHKYDHLRGTNGDIKVQRQMVRDSVPSDGDAGYAPPDTNRDGTVKGGLPPPVTSAINPTDLLDPEKRPDDLPVPKDAIHAKQIASFLNRYPKEKSEETEETVSDTNLSEIDKQKSHADSNTENTNDKKEDGGEPVRTDVTYSGLLE